SCPIHTALTLTCQNPGVNVWQNFWTLGRRATMFRLQRPAIMVPLLVLAVFFVACPAFAQMDFSGEWQPIFYEDEPERVAGPEIGDYTGIPINDAARMRGDTWMAAVQTLPEWQCRPHSADYIWRGPSQLRITKEV